MEAAAWARRLVSVTLTTHHDTLVSNADAVVTHGARVALAGKNGVGKSTLLKAMAGASPHGYWTVHGRLLGADRAVYVAHDDMKWSELLTLHDSLGMDEAETRAMAVPDALDAAQCSEEHGAAWTECAEAWRRLVVAGSDALGWGNAKYDSTPISELSPGCAARAFIAIALLHPDIHLLLLDEPTSHLDLPTILWLERAIVASRKTVVTVSHDEAFLDAVCDHVWILEGGTLNTSAAKYSAFRHARESQREQQRIAYQHQQDRNKRLTAVAEKLRFASASGARFKGTDNDTMQRDFKRDRAGRSASKVRWRCRGGVCVCGGLCETDRHLRLTAQQQQAKAVETRRDAEPSVEPVTDNAPLRFSIDALGAGADSSVVLSAVELGHAANRPLPIPPLSLRIEFGERVAILGLNGVGKSTLMGTITRALEPVAGDVKVGRELRLGNLMQTHDALSRTASPREHIAETTGVDSVIAGKKCIGFGLTRHQMDAPIGELNPGARARLVLATFTLRKCNFLVLDEPSNYLDEEAMMGVAASLQGFDGTVLLTSHSRGFLEAASPTRVLLLDERGLTELPSVDAFADAAADGVAHAIAQVWG